VWVASPEDGGSAIPVDESQPNSTLQVKTYDGKRLRIKYVVPSFVIMLILFEQAHFTQ
jgi:hypothetical protein